MASTIIGATSMQQLQENLGAAELTLDQEVLADIQEVYRQHPVPM